MGFLGGQRKIEGSAEGALPRDDAGLSVATAGETPWAQQSVLTSRRWVTTMLTLVGASLLVMIASLRFGAEDIGFTNVSQILFLALRHGQDGVESISPAGIILLQVRLPRVLLGFMVGSSLAAVGVGLQALLRNPLADPYVLGISSGAALGAAVAMLLGIGTTVLALSAISLCAFLGGLLSLVVVYRIALSYGHLPVHTLLLAGVILNAIFSALIMFVTATMNPNRSFGMMSWLMGTMTAPDYPALTSLALYLLVGGLILVWQARPLNILTLGEESARSLGVEVERVKKTVFFTSALLTGAVVSVSGLIGFVGMVIPHAVRMVIGPDHRLLLPASALVGGMFLLAADTVARTLLAPAEIPVGVVTALAGGPFFIYLLTSRKGGLAR
ncbi:MAG TPA: iron ABC transporter permease [Nitrospiraceae bacterium]|nr:iron ABC transporter permease [Nitrospiraceae bacterium]